MLPKNQINQWQGVKTHNNNSVSSKMYSAGVYSTVLFLFLVKIVIQKSCSGLKVIAKTKLAQKIWAYPLHFELLTQHRRPLYWKHFPLDLCAHFYVFGIRGACRMGKDIMLKMSHKKRVLTKCGCLIPWSDHTPLNEGTSTLSLNKDALPDEAVSEKASIEWSKREWGGP